MDTVLYWNSVLLEVSRRDFTSGMPNGQQAGPIGTSRAMAIVHLAIHDTVAYSTNGGTGAAYIAKKGGTPPVTPSVATSAAPGAGDGRRDVRSEGCRRDSCSAHR